MRKNKDLLLDIRDLRIEGFADDEWFEIVHGVDLQLHRGEVMGLIGESGAGKSTIGLAAMGFARDGCRFSDGEVVFDGMDLTGKAVGTIIRGNRVMWEDALANAAIGEPVRFEATEYS